MPAGIYKRTEKHKGKNASNYIDGKTLIKHYCIDCGKEISTYAKRCKSCDSRKNWWNPEFKEKNKAFKGKKHTKEKKEYLSKINIERLKNPEEREKMSGKNNPRYIDGRCLRKYYCVDCGKELSTWTVKRCYSCDAKQRWQNLEYREKIIKIRNMPKYKEKKGEKCKKHWQEGIFDGVFQSPTNPEKEIMKILEELKINYVFQFRPKDFSMVYDFYIPILNLLIEFDGIYWHSLPEVKERDMKKTEYADKNNYILLRFNENNLINFQYMISERFNNIIMEENKNEINYVPN